MAKNELLKFVAKSPSETQFPQTVWLLTANAQNTLSTGIFDRDHHNHYHTVVPVETVQLTAPYTVNDGVRRVRQTPTMKELYEKISERIGFYSNKFQKIVWIAGTVGGILPLAALGLAQNLPQLNNFFENFPITTELTLPPAFIGALIGCIAGIMIRNNMANGAVSGETGLEPKIIEAISKNY